MTRTENMPSTSLLFALFGVLLVIAANFSISVMAGPYIGSDLGANSDITIYIIAFYGLGTALSIPLGKPLAARLGSSKALILCLLAVVFTLWLCAIAPNYPLFVGYRFLSGLAGGPLYPILNHLLTNLVPQKYLPRIMLIFVTILTVGPVSSAALGGTIAYEYHWRWAFYLCIPFVALLAAFAWGRLRENPLAPEKEPFDAIGYLFFWLGIFPLSFMLITAQQLDWYRSPLLVTCFFIGLPSFLFFFLWSLNHPYPILKLHYFQKWAFSYGMLNLAVLYSAYFGTITLLPLWLTLYVRYTPLWIGAILGGMGVAGLVPALLVRERLDRFDPRYTLAIAIFLFTISSFNTTIFNVDINFGRIATSRIVAGFGLAFLLPSLSQIAFRSFPQNQSVDVIAIFQVVRNLSSGVGAALYQILWQRRQTFFHERLGEQLNVFSRTTKDFFQKTEQYFVSGDPNAQLEYYLERQARALGLDDVFWLMGWILIGLMIILLLSLHIKFKPDPSYEQK